MVARLQPSAIHVRWKYLRINEFLTTKCLAHDAGCEKFVSIQRIESKKAWTIFCCECGNRSTVSDKYLEEQGVEDNYDA